MNSSEEYLSSLCNNTFLSLWSYPNLYIDKGRKNKKGDGKELCDLLVVFEEHVIIFSDKTCDFPSTSDIRLNWSRWFKRTIKSSASQILGAERNIKDNHSNIYLDKECTKKLPVIVPNDNKAKLHRIIVANGASEACRNHFNGGSGSLLINTTIVEDEHWDLNNADLLPFYIGKINVEHGYIHIFDDITLGIVMQTLDTVTDFIQYLVCKEKLMNEKTVFAFGEEDIIAEYLKNIDINGNHCFAEEEIYDKASSFLFSEGNWLDFCNNLSRLAQIEENKISYLWDGLIEKFLFHVTTGTSECMTPPTISEQEMLFRLMAKENRTRRRVLSKALSELVDKTPPGRRNTRGVTIENSTTSYFFFLFPYSSNFCSYEEYRKVRRVFLNDYLIISKTKLPNILDIIGLAIDTYNPDSQHNSEDLLYLDVRDWTNDDQIHAEQLEKEYLENGWLRDRVYLENEVREYPDIINN